MSCNAPSASSGYVYDEAVSRNIGWVTLEEQQRLQSAKVAIAGLGGVGGQHALILARLGVGGFALADFDTFGVHNFNRQAGAFVSTVGQPKLAVMSRMLADINPQARIAAFPQGVTSSNLRDFLAGADVYVDGLDFFELGIRRQVFAACRELGVPAITAAPLGMGVSLLYFDPRGMSFEEYFRLEGCDRQEQYARFIAGLSPAMLQRTYLADPAAVNFAERRGPSTPMACDLCAAMVGTAVLKLVLRRGHLHAAPRGLHFDAYRQRMVTTWRPFGNANPLQRLLLRFIRPRLTMSAG